MEKSRVGLKVTATVTGIVVGVIALAVIFHYTLLPVWKYNVAVSNAEKGEYALATRGLYENNYKDSEIKLQQYALNAGKQFVEDGNTESAIAYLTLAVQNGENEELRKEAEALLATLTK